MLVFDGSSVKMVRGKLSRSLVQGVEDVLLRTKSEHGEIHLSGDGKIHFLGKIKAQSHQGIRNVLIGQS